MVIFSQLVAISSQLVVAYVTYGTYTSWLVVIFSQLVVISSQLVVVGGGLRDLQDL